MIRVWTDNSTAGVLDRSRQRGTTFVYEPAVLGDRAVSVTMPVRLASWDTPLGVAPIFEMNLPEGALRERLRLAFAKATGRFDDLDLLAIVGRSQLGRIRFLAQTISSKKEYRSSPSMRFSRAGEGESSTGT